MDYCTNTDITDRYGVAKIAQLTGDPSGVTVDTGKVDEIIVDVSSLIDGYVGKQHTLPFAPAEVPAFLKKIAIEEVYYALKDSSPSGANSISEILFKQHSERLKVLEKIAQGKVTLGFYDSTAGENITQPRPEEPLKTKTRMFEREA